MQRIPEPELMDAADQAAAYSAADFSGPNELFVELFARHFPGFTRGHVLDLGCGPADIPIRMLQRFPGLRVTAVDGAAAMLDLARHAVAAAGLAGRVVLQQARVDRTLGITADAVVSNSLLHHLADPAQLWACVRACAGPGAPVLVMDLMRPDTESTAHRLVDEYAGGEPEVLRQDFFNSLCAAYRPEELREQLQQAGLARLSVVPVSDRHMAVIGHL